MADRGDQLLRHVLSGGNDSAANALLNEFFRGYPVEKLRLLLESNEVNAFKAGAWIASELGEKVAPLVGELSRWLNHPSRYVRFFLLDAILGAATADHGEALAQAVRLIQDPDEAVRWKVLQFLTKATKDQLNAAVPHVTSNTVATSLAWLAGAGLTRRDKEEVVARLADADPVTRMFAAAAAARLGPHDPLPLKQAAASNDPEVKSFAKEELEALQSRPPQRH